MLGQELGVFIEFLGDLRVRSLPPPRGTLAGSELPGQGGDQRGALGWSSGRVSWQL